MGNYINGLKEIFSLHIQEQHFSDFRAFLHEEKYVKIRKAASKCFLSLSVAFSAATAIARNIQLPTKLNIPFFLGIMAIQSLIASALFYLVAKAQQAQLSPKQKILLQLEEINQALMEDNQERDELGSYSLIENANRNGELVRYIGVKILGDIGSHYTKKIFSILIPDLTSQLHHEDVRQKLLTLTLLANQKGWFVEFPDQIIPLKNSKHDYDFEKDIKPIIQLQFDYALQSLKKFHSENIQVPIEFLNEQLRNVFPVKLKSEYVRAIHGDSDSVHAFVYFYSMNTLRLTSDTGLLSEEEDFIGNLIQSAAEEIQTIKLAGNDFKGENFRQLLRSDGQITVEPDLSFITTHVHVLK
ncbi:MAG: hypothetical protein Tsb0021_08080 [Chlamydiales bacterium]